MHIEPDLVIGDIRLLSLKSLGLHLRELGNPAAFEIPFLNTHRVPVLRLPSGDYCDLDVLSLCLACALSPGQPNIVVPPATPPASAEQTLDWRFRLTLDDLARGLHVALARLLTLRGSPPSFPARDALLRAARRFTHCIDGLRPLLMLKINDDALLAHLRDSLTRDTPPPRMSIGDPWRPTITREPPTGQHAQPPG